MVSHDGALIDVHDVVGFGRDLGRAHAPQVGGDLPPLCQRLGEEVPSPRRVAQRCAQAQVARVVRAQEIAMREQHFASMELDLLEVAEQSAARGGAKLVAEQEIAVAVHDGARHAGRSQARERVEDRSQIGVVVVVADPCLEQIAEDVYAVGRHGLGSDEVDELARRRGPAGIEMQVGDEQRGAGQGYWSTRSMR